MSYIDSLQVFSTNQVLATGSTVSTNVLPLTIADGFGSGEPMAVVINVIVAADATDADETYEFQLQTGATETPTDVIAKVGFGGTNELVEATLIAGYQIVLPIPPGTTPNAFLRLNYILGGTTPSITVSADMKPMNMIVNNFRGGHADDKTII